MQGKPPNHGTISAPHAGSFLRGVSESCYHTFLEFYRLPVPRGLQGLPLLIYVCMSLAGRQDLQPFSAPACLGPLEAVADKSNPSLNHRQVAKRCESELGEQQWAGWAQVGCAQVGELRVGVASRPGVI